MFKFIISPNCRKQNSQELAHTLATVSEVLSFKPIYYY